MLSIYDLVLCIADRVYTQAFDIYDFRSFRLEGYILDDLMKYPEKVLLKLPEGTLSQIDAQSSNRSEFIRETLEARLAGKPVPEPEAGVAYPVPKGMTVREASEVLNPSATVLQKARTPEPKKMTSKQMRLADAQEVVKIARTGRFSSRQIAEKLGWLGLRFARAEEAALNLKLVRVDGGCLVAVDGED